MNPGFDIVGDIAYNSIRFQGRYHFCYLAEPRPARLSATAVHIYLERGGGHERWKRNLEAWEAAGTAGLSSFTFSTTATGGCSFRTAGVGSSPT